MDRSRYGMIVTILITIVVLMLLYAPFSNKTDLRNSKRDENLSIRCQSGIYDKIKLILIKELKEQSYINSFCEVNKNKVTIGTSLLEEKAVRYFTIKLSNTGNTNLALPINKIKQVGGEITIYNNEDYYTPLKTYDYKQVEYKAFDEKILDFSSIGVFILEKEDGSLINITNDEKEWNKNLVIDEDGTLYLRIKPLESIYVLYKNEWLNYCNENNDEFCKNNEFNSKHIHTKSIINFPIIQENSTMKEVVK